MPARLPIGPVLPALLACVGLAAGCGEPLTPEQQVRYDRAKLQRDSLRKEVGSANRRLTRTFTTAAKAEKGAGAKTDRSLLCGKSRKSSHVFGPFAVGKKQGYRVELLRKGDRRAAGTTCTKAQAKVRKP